MRCRAAMSHTPGSAGNSAHASRRYPACNAANRTTQSPFCSDGNPSLFHLDADRTRGVAPPPIERAFLHRWSAVRRCGAGAPAAPPMRKSASRVPAFPRLQSGCGRRASIVRARRTGFRRQRAWSLALPPGVLTVFDAGRHARNRTAKDAYDEQVAIPQYSAFIA